MMSGQCAPFGRLAGNDTVYRYSLSGGGLEAHILGYGATLQDLRLAGHAPPLVLGLTRLADYCRHSPFFGASVGRVANRIGGARARIGAQIYQFDRNDNNRHTLHGGRAGSAWRNWRCADLAAAHVTLSTTLPDGDMGFPGRLEVKCTYRLAEEAALEVHFTARSDADTLCGFAHHSYFNLDGRPQIDMHELQIDARAFLPVDGDLIPVGECRDVAGTPMDFRNWQPLLTALPGNRASALRLDHNFCLDAPGPVSPSSAPLGPPPGTAGAGPGNAMRAQRAMRRVAGLRSRASQLEMRVLTNDFGLQVYDGRKIAVPVAGLDGRRYGPHAGIALEPQNWPDAPGHAHFPCAVLKAGEIYRHSSRFEFIRAG